MSAISKLLDKNCSFLNMLPLKCIQLIDQMDSGQSQPTCTLHIPSKLHYYTSKNQNGGYFCLRLYIQLVSIEPILEKCVHLHVISIETTFKWKVQKHRVDMHFSNFLFFCISGVKGRIKSEFVQNLCDSNICHLIE